MYKYLNTSLLFLGMLILVIGFVNPGKVKANDEPSNGCTESLSAEAYLGKAFFHINRGTARLESIERKDATETLIHSAGYKTSGEWLVRAWQKMSCAKIITKIKLDSGLKDITTPLITKTEGALYLAAKALTDATKADSDFVRKNNLKVLQPGVEYEEFIKALPGTEGERLAKLKAAYTAYKAVATEIKAYREVLLKKSVVIKTSP